MESSPLETVRSVAAVLREKYASFMAGSVAYSAFVSVFSLMVVGVSLAAVVGADPVYSRGAVLAGVYLPPTASRVLSAAAGSARESPSVPILSGLISVWGAIKVFRGMDTAFSEIYETGRRNSFRDRLRDGAVVFVALGLALLVSSISFSLVFLLPDPSGLLVPLVLLVGLAVAFFPMFYVFPDVDVTVREVVPGVIVASVGWTVLQLGFRYYAGVADRYELFGVLGGVLLVLTWLYLASLLLLVGAAVNVVLADRAGSPRAADR